MKLIKLFTLLFSLFLTVNVNAQCNTNTTICDNNSLAGPFNFQPASANPSSCLDYFNGQAAPNYAYIILYITQSGNLNLLVDGNANTGFLDVAIFDITGSTNPCNDLNLATEISCNYASSASGCSQFGTQFPCPASVPAPAVQAGDVIMILVEDWSDDHNSFTLDLSNAPGSAQTGPPDATITAVGPFCENDSPLQLNAVNMGGTWVGNGTSNTGVFNPSLAGVGTHTISYSIGSAPCQDQDQINIVVNQVDNSVINDTVCSGTLYTFPDGTNQVINSPTTQISTLLNIAGCDSIITTNIEMSQSVNITNNFTICSGDSYTFPDGTTQTNITTNTTQVSTLTSTGGCDSIITTNLLVNSSYNLTEFYSVCSGDSYNFPDGNIINNIVNPVTYISNLNTVNGCDSIITTDILVNPIYSIVENVSVCIGGSYTFPDGTTQNNINNPITHVSNLITVNGCDSIITTSVGVFPSYNTTLNTSTCNGNLYTFADGTSQILTTSTTYVSNLISSNGCDSLVTENVTVNPTYNLVENFDQCPGLNFTFPDGTVMTNINSNIVHVSNLTTINGCDSIITTNLNIYDLPDFDISITENGCPDIVIAITNNTIGNNCSWVITGPGTYQTYSGCDLITDLYTNSGTYNVNLTMTSPDGCPMDTSISNAFEVYPVPVADFNWDPNEGSVILNNTITFNNTSIGGSSYQWNFGDGTTSTSWNYFHTYQDSGSYVVQLIVENDYGCSDTTQGLVLIHEEFFIFVPNAFTPDGDQHNNTFLPIISGHDPYSYELLIFNRWGELIFESRNSEVGWDGTYNGGIVQDGSYIWKINVKTNRNIRRNYIGHVNVLR